MPRPYRKTLVRLALAALCALLGSLPPALAASEDSALLTAHNDWRAKVGVAPLAWSAELAADAARWATRLEKDNACRMRHSPHDTRPDAGENLFWASPTRWSDGRTEVQTITGRQVADDWASERLDYDHARNACAPGKPCGHYTQMVWRNSRELGCARHVCASRAQLWVCRYRPAGNYVGERPY